MPACTRQERKKLTPTTQKALQSSSSPSQGSCNSLAIAPIRRNRPVAGEIGRETTPHLFDDKTLPCLCVYTWAERASAPCFSLCTTHTHRPLLPGSHKGFSGQFKKKSAKYRNKSTLSYYSSIFKKVWKGNIF